MKNTISSKPKQTVKNDYPAVAWKGVIFDKEIKTKDGNSFVAKGGILGMNKADGSGAVNVNVKLSEFKSWEGFILKLSTKKDGKWEDTQIGLLSVQKVYDESKWEFTNQYKTDKNGNKYFGWLVEAEGFEPLEVRLFQAPEGKPYSMFFSAKSAQKTDNKSDVKEEIPVEAPESAPDEIVF